MNELRERLVEVWAGLQQNVIDDAIKPQVVVWRSRNVLGQINEVTLHQARLVLGWVTVYGRVNYLGM